MAMGRSAERLVILHIRIPESIHRLVEGMVRSGMYASRSEAYREIIRLGLVARGAIADRPEGAKLLYGEAES